MAWNPFYPVDFFKGERPVSTFVPWRSRKPFDPEIWWNLWKKWYHTDFYARTFVPSFTAAWYRLFCGVKTVVWPDGWNENADGINHIDKLDFLEAYPSGRTEAFRSDTIKNSFGAAGLVPFHLIEWYHSLIFGFKPRPPLWAGEAIGSRKRPQITFN